MSSGFEIYSIRIGPDGLAQITEQRLGELVSRSWLVPATKAEDSVLDVWAEFHDRMLGYPPSW